MRLLSMLMLTFCLTGCAALHSVSITEIPQNRNRRVEAEVSKFIFLAFNFDNDYIAEILDKLKRQCKGGKVEGILTKDESYNYFLAHKRVIKANGYCIRTPRKA